ncbi:MAG: hypothetical protein M1830_009501 [Pleopsidium flavum]|nr:MAG: hypothetical protein M1830_009501 [Pleopsidium flavum]
MPLQLPRPHPGKLNDHFLLGEIIDHVSLFLPESSDVDILELRQQLVALRNEQGDPQQQTRGFLRAFKRTAAFQKGLDQLGQRMRTQLEAFIDGQAAEDVIGSSPAHISPSPTTTKRHSRLLNIFDFCLRIEQNVEKRLSHVFEVRGCPMIYEDADKTKVMEPLSMMTSLISESCNEFQHLTSIKVYSNTPFENWGRTVKNVPKYTFVPTKVLGLQNLVKYAKANNLRVRCSGYRHSWSPTFSANREILVSLLNLDQVAKIPDRTSVSPTPLSNVDNELKVIELAPTSPPASPNKRLVRVGVAVTNEEFRRWAVSNNAWTLPMDVILVEVTIGGVNAPICHGAGRRNKTLSDQVRVIEYVDANGQHQLLSDNNHLKAAAGCFGLLGLVTHITFELHAMTYAVMKPRKRDIGLAIPPLNRSDVPLALHRTWTDTQLAEALKDFESSAADDYYCEWFWFTYQTQAWVNVWNTTTETTDVVDYPAPWQVWLQWVQEWIGGIVTTSTFFQALPSRWQTQLLATLAMAYLPPTSSEAQAPEIKSYLPDALHFRRGIQNMRVRDMEFQIPIPPLASDPSKPDFSIVRRAWWDVINIVYEDAESPMRLAMELRIMGGSDILMAPQYGNQHGTASIEVLTIPDAVTDEEWQPFMQKVCDVWMSYEVDGVRLNVRPHWAKEW